MADHAKIFSASSFERLMLCPGSTVLTADAPRTSSQYAAEGTAIHAAAAARLLGGQYPALGGEIAADGVCFTWDADMEAVAQEYVDYVKGLNADNLWVETRVSFGASIGLPADSDDGFGTADAIAAKGSELVVIDLKCGRGVDVQAEDNPQLMLYALGALELLDGVAGDYDRVRLVIVQPRAGGVKEHVITKAELLQWASNYGVHTVKQVQLAIASYPDAAQGADGGWSATYLEPGEKQCRFCPAKATCPALRAEVAETVMNQSAPATPDEFADTTLVMADADKADYWLAACMSKVDLIEDWCKAVRAEAERRLLAGEEVPGFKVVQGKKGNRAWSDPSEVEKMFKDTFRLKIEEMYDLKLISPTSAEKLHKAGAIGPRQWPKLAALITQSDGKPHVAPVSDPRPALDVRPVREEFQDLTSDLA